MMEGNKLWKTRPWLEKLRQNFLKLFPEEFNSVNEIMAPCKGMIYLRQYLPNKTHTLKVGEVSGKTLKDIITRSAKASPESYPYSRIGFSFVKTLGLPSQIAIFTQTNDNAQTVIFCFDVLLYMDVYLFIKS